MPNFWEYGPPSNAGGPVTGGVGAAGLREAEKKGKIPRYPGPPTAVPPGGIVGGVGWGGLQAAEHEGYFPAYPTMPNIDVETSGIGAPAYVSAWDAAQTQKGWDYINQLIAQGQGVPTAMQVQAYEAQFVPGMKYPQGSTMHTMGWASHEEYMRGQAKSTYGPHLKESGWFASPTKFPESWEEFTTLNPTLSKDPAKLEAAQKEMGNKYLEYAVAILSKGQETEGAYSTVDKIVALLDSGVWGAELPLFHEVRNLAAQLGQATAPGAATPRAGMPYLMKDYTPQQFAETWPGYTPQTLPDWLLEQRSVPGWGQPPPKKKETYPQYQYPQAPKPPVRTPPPKDWQKPWTRSFAPAARWLTY